MSEQQAAWLAESLARLLVFCLGTGLVLGTIASAVRTFVVPRAQNSFLTRLVFIASGRLFNVYMKLRGYRDWRERDRVLAFFAPVTLLILPLVWVVCITLGYALIYRALGVNDLETALTVSGSSLLTLGTTPFISFGITIVQFSEATLGLGLVALLIAYLPTMYGAFSRREARVEMLAVRAGTPPSAIEMLLRLQRIDGFGDLRDTWQEWEVWFTELEESHTSLAPLIFFRSPVPEQSWVTAAGAIMDAGALLTAAVDMPPDPAAQLCLRAGYTSLRRIADFFYYEYDQDPLWPDVPVSITREEFDSACETLAAGGLPLRPDREAAWAAFAGWRVNYDDVLLFLADITQAPWALWSSDRGRVGRSVRRIRLLRRRRRQRP